MAVFVMQIFRVFCICCVMCSVNEAMAAPLGLRPGELSLSDPTKPPPFAMPVILAPRVASGVSAMPVVPEFQLQGIIEPGNGQRLAVINQKLYAVGEQVGNANVVEIDVSHVTLRNDAGRQVLRLVDVSGVSQQKK